MSNLLQEDALSLRNTTLQNSDNLQTANPSLQESHAPPDDD